MNLAQNFTAKGEQSQMAGALNRLGQRALVASADSGLSPGANFAIIGDEPPQDFRLLVVNAHVLIGAELAFARPGEETPASDLRFVLGG